MVWILKTRMYALRTSHVWFFFLFPFLLSPHSFFFLLLSLLVVGKRGLPSYLDISTTHTHTHSSILEFHSFLYFPSHQPNFVPLSRFPAPSCFWILAWSSAMGSFSYFFPLILSGLDGKRNAVETHQEN